MILNPATPIEKVSGDRPFRAGNGGRVGAISTNHEKRDFLRCASDTLLHHLSLVLSDYYSYRGTKLCGNIALLTWYAYLCTFLTRDNSFDNVRGGVPHKWPRMMTTMVTIFTVSTTRQLKNTSKRSHQRRTNVSGVRRKLNQCVDLLHQV